MAALVEQHHDDFGIRWPREVAPYEVAIVIINAKIEAQVEAAERLYEQLRAAGHDVVLDDRDERAGVKFNDMDLIGVPYRITVGKALEQGQVELKHRSSSDVSLIDVDAVLDTLNNFIKTA